MPKNGFIYGIRSSKRDEAHRKKGDTHKAEKNQTEEQHGFVLEIESWYQNKVAEIEE